MDALRINHERLWQSLMDMARIGATPRGGVCRVALTDLDRQGRDLFVRWAREAGCTVEIDQMGRINLSHKAMMPRPEGGGLDDRGSRNQGGHGGNRNNFHHGGPRFTRH